MRQVARVLFMAMLGLALAGCKQRQFEGPTVDAFNGRVVRDGEPVSFPEGEEVSLRLFSEKGQSLGIPLKSDGTFKIGEMGQGKYTVQLLRSAKAGKGQAPRIYNVPGGLNIEPGKTDYTIELGKDWKP
jgi:hypothetical protein